MLIPSSGSSSHAMTIRGLVTCDLRLANTTSLVTSEAPGAFAVARVCAADAVGAAPFAAAPVAEVGAECFGTTPSCVPTPWQPPQSCRRMGPARLEARAFWWGTEGREHATRHSERIVKSTTGGPALA